MEKINVGEYVRSHTGFIGKVAEIERDVFLNDDKGILICFTKNVVKTSKDIIDLIEECDFVNGEEVDKIKIDENGEKYIKTVFNNVFRDKDIESILTHEQYEQNSYKIGE